MRDCEHGQLARSCDRCDDAQRICELEAEVEALRAERERIGRELLAWHEQDKSRHSYWLCAHQRLFGAT